jgi:DNA-directed RNA polymerase II subunit RPB2
VNAGLVEYIDAWELLEYRVAFEASEIEEDARFPHTHLAMHPTALLGVCASTVPWSDHDQAPRVSYQAGMVKQAIGTPATNLQDRMDMNYAFQLWYPQTPIADTIISRSRGLHDWPMGENKMIAIASYTGTSQEDAIIVNRGTIDRGSGRVFIYRMFKCIDDELVLIMKLLKMHSIRPKELVLAFVVNPIIQKLINMAYHLKMYTTKW